jgi:ribosome recycling factor
MEELELIVASVKQRWMLQSSIWIMLFKNQSGRASTSMVQDVMVEYYGHDSNQSGCERFCT